MKPIQTNILTSQQALEVKALQKLCYQYEGLENAPSLTNELNTDQSLPCFFLMYDSQMLIGFLNGFFPTSQEVEINALVHPSYRKQGVFTTLVSEAQKAYASHPFLQMLFQVEPSSRSGKAYVKKRFPTIDRSEYRLKLSKSCWQHTRPPISKKGILVEATGEYLDLFIQTATTLLKEDALSVERLLANPGRKGYLYLYEDKPIGMLQKCKEDENLTMLYAVAINEAFRGQGHGKTMLTLALDTFFATGESISLEVDSQNPQAFGLYVDLGFEIDFQVDYHSLILSYL